MGYNTIGYSDDVKVIGSYPQTVMMDGYDPSLPTSHWQVKPNSFPDFEPLYEIKLQSEAYPTNYLQDDHANFGMTIDGKFKNVLEQFCLPPHRFYPIKVYDQNEKLLEYYWFHYIVEDFWKHVDKGQSSAQIYKKFEFKVEEIIPLPNLDRIRDFEDDLPFDKQLRINNIVFKDTFPEYDVIKIVDVEFSPRLISDRLLEKLKSESMTGFESMPFKKISTSF